MRVSGRVERLVLRVLLEEPMDVVDVLSVASIKDQDNELRPAFFFSERLLRGSLMGVRFWMEPHRVRAVRRNRFA